MDFDNYQAVYIQRYIDYDRKEGQACLSYEKRVMAIWAILRDADGLEQLTEEDIEIKKRSM